MENKIIFLFIILFLFGTINSGDPVAELNADEETDSDCFNTENPQSAKDCVNKESAEEDEYCCFFEIETHKKVKVNKCAGLTKFQYDHIKLYVKEKMDELLFRDLHIHCNSSTIKIFYLFLLFFAY